MRKALFLVPMLLLLLTSCGVSQENDVSLQQQYAGVTEANLEADITCHYDDELRTLTMLCAYTPDSSSITVLSPAELAGISATVEQGNLTLSYEDISLDAGSYSAADISPVAVLPKLMEAASSGYITEQSEESYNDRNCYRMSADLSQQEGLLYTTWFDQETLLPLYSEVTVDDTVVFEVTWTRFEVISTAEASS